MGGKTKSRAGASGAPLNKNREIGYQAQRLERYFYRAPYGSRYWVLAPFVENENQELREQILEDFGDIPGLRYFDPHADDPAQEASSHGSVI